jgi:hypothetical protein
MRNNDEMEQWRLGEIERELLEIAARARMSTTDYGAALMAELRRIERVVRKPERPSDGRDGSQGEAHRPNHDDYVLRRL